MQQRFLLQILLLAQHVSGALCTHHQEYIKTVDAITGTSHMSVWYRFKSAKSWS